VLAAGCGSSATTPKVAFVPVVTPTSTPATTTAPPAATTTRSTSTAATKTKASTTPRTTTKSVPTTSTATSTTPLPATPSGLTAATGYSSYDNCQGVCTGSVPSSLRRPLHLPSLGAGGSCPLSHVASAASFAGQAIGSGPVYAAQPSTLPVTGFTGSSWEGGPVTWVAAPSYVGPVLIRGGLVSGSGPVGFGEGNIPVDELQLLTASVKSSGEPSGAREWPSFTRVRSVPGCYAYQVDGTSFSEVIVFQATG